MELTKKKTLVIYAYFENATYLENLKFFLKHGTSAPNTDYFVIANGKISINCPPNVRLIKRRNQGWDFGAWTHALSLVDSSKYDYFIFINATVRGPFLPSWAKKQDWTKSFTEKINDETKLVGTTINCYGGNSLHVQSMLLATDQEGLEIAKKTGVFCNENYTKAQALTKELLFSRAIMNAGYNIGCMLLAYDNLDFRKVKCENANTKHQGDPLFGSSYFGINVNPFEILFIKTNRSINKGVLDKYTNWINAGR